MEKTQFQFELWEECNSKCSFCYLGNNNRLTLDKDKINNIADVLMKINDNHFMQNINCLGYIGGEFFQGQLKNNDVKIQFMRLMNKTNELLNHNIIDNCWISASLLIGDQKDLYDALNVFSDKSKIWILTSYDTIGRFHSNKEKNDWINNLKMLRKTYSDIKINITSITTGDFIEKYLNDSLDLYQIAETYSCSVFLKPPCNIEGINSKIKTNEIIRNFFPTRSSMLKFLIKYRQNFSDFLYEKLFNIKYRSEYLYLYGHRQKFMHRIKNLYQENSINVEIKDKHNIFDNLMPCNHSFQYQCYIDSNKCLICDKNAIKMQFN